MASCSLYGGMWPAGRAAMTRALPHRACCTKSCAITSKPSGPRPSYLLKEDFHQFWDYTSPTWAGHFLDDWCRHNLRSRIEPMKKIAKMLRSHRALILNYFKAKNVMSSGVVEGLNNKAKVTMRTSYGFRTFRVTELALYHTLGKLPEPELTHRFY